MNNRDAYEFLSSKTSIRAAVEEFMSIHQLEQGESSSLRHKFCQLRPERDSYRKFSDLSTWEEMLFFSFSPTLPLKKRISDEKIIFKADLSQDKRKPLSELTLKSVRLRLSSLLNLVEALAEKEQTTPTVIAAYVLQLISNDNHDRSVAGVCKDIINNGTFSPTSLMPLEKSVYLLDLLEIGKRKYTDFRLLCKSEGLMFPQYSKLADYRANIVLSNELSYLQKGQSENIGIKISYRSLLKQTLSRLVQTIPQFDESKYPLTFKISDGLDGSGCHKVYNQLQENPNFTTKNFIIFAFKPLKLTDTFGNILWSNSSPNSPFSVRPVALLSQKENEENVKFIMETIINPEVTEIERDGFSILGGHVKVEIFRTMLDGKMSQILSGAGGASCQLCTATHGELKDLELIRSGYPINRTISSALDIFNAVDPEEFLSLPSKDRFGLTHQPLSDKDIVSASPLHTYTCVFRWFMLLVYHLQSGCLHWKPTSKQIETSMKFTRTFLQEKTGLKIDQPTSDGGTTSTGNIARQCFLNKNDFINWVATLIPSEFRDTISIVHSNISAILRVYNSSQAVETEILDALCKDTYELIVVTFPWANITPTLHKLLAHCTELIHDCNQGYGLKEYSEEAVEACNKLIRKYRDHLARKSSFSLNVRDIFIRLLCQSDPILRSLRRTLICSNCGELGHSCRTNCTSSKPSLLAQDELVNSLLIAQ